MPNDQKPSTLRNLPEASWTRLANRLLLKHVTTRLSTDPYAWGDWGPTNSYYPCPHRSLHDAPQAESTRIAVHHKNLFVQALSGMTERPHPDIVRELWQQTVSTFETEIRATNPRQTRNWRSQP